MEYEIRNADDAERCLCALLDYMDSDPSAGEFLVGLVKMKLLLKLAKAKARRKNNDIIREG